MKQLPARWNLDHLRKQAKDLIRVYRNRDAGAIAQFRENLPAAANRSDDEIVSLKLRLHDAQSCVARGYGFESWADLRRYVETQSASHTDREARVLEWLKLVYPGDVSGTLSRANPRVASRILAENPDLVGGDPYLGCAIGDEDLLRHATNANPAWIDRPGGPLKLPPLLALAHSSLLQIPELRDRLHRSARYLLSAGATPNQSIGNRWSPASLAEPDDANPLSALYGAAGQNRDRELTQILLEAGTNPNDGESLYHSLENLACTRLLLVHGARIEGTNAFYRVFDFDNLAALELLLRHGANPNEPARNPPLTDLGSPLLWAIKRRRSRRHIEVLLRAGADPSARTPSGIVPYNLAMQLGLEDVADLLRENGRAEVLSEEEQFIAACARCDELGARRIQSIRPDLPGSLTEGAIAVVAGYGGSGRRWGSTTDG